METATVLPDDEEEQGDGEELSVDAGGDSRSACDAVIAALPCRRPFSGRVERCFLGVLKQWSG